MKILKALCFSLFATGAIYAQDVDQRLLEHYSETELETMKMSETKQYKQMVYALDNGMYVIDNPSEKGGSFPEITVLNTDQLPTYLDLNLTIKDENQYFKISGSDKLLVVKSAWVLNHEMTKK